MMRQASKRIPESAEKTVRDIRRATRRHHSAEEKIRTVRLPTDLGGRAIDPKLTTYSTELKTKILTRGGVSYIYFDQARAIRE
jgi:hypothetical protein